MACLQRGRTESDALIQGQVQATNDSLREKIALKTA